MSDQPDFIEVQRYLDGVEYPSRPDQLAEAARRNGAPDRLVELIAGLPDRPFDGPTEVTHEITGRPGS